MKRLLLFIGAVLCLWEINAEIVPDTWHRPDFLISLDRNNTVSWSDEYTIFSVVRSLSDSTAECLWSFAENDTVSAAVLTKGVYTSATGTLVSHHPHDFSKWCVYAYHSGIKADSTKQRSLRLGKQPIYTDSTPVDTLHAKIEMEELAFFNRNVSRLISGAFQTYLALKYGVTLDFAPYISLSGDTLWHPEYDKDFYHRVVGIGNDTVYGWNSCISQSKEDSLLYIQTDSLLPNEYIVMGDDGGSAFWHRGTDNKWEVQRVWRIRQLVNHPKHITIVFRSFLMDEPADSLRLVITDANGIEQQTILPDSIVGDSLCYFSIDRTDTLMHFQIKGVLQSQAPSMQGDYGSHAESSCSNTDILFDMNTQTIVIDGFPGGQVFTLYLYDNSGRYLAALSGLNPINVSALPYTVSYIEIMAGNRIVGALNIPAIIF